jgi:hypothetical protein
MGASSAHQRLFEINYAVIRPIHRLVVIHRPRFRAEAVRHLTCLAAYMLRHANTLGGVRFDNFYSSSHVHLANTYLLDVLVLRVVSPAKRSKARIFIV